MGLAIAIIVFPAYIIISIVSVILAIRTIDQIEDHEKYFSKSCYAISGAILIHLLASYSLKMTSVWFPTASTQGWNPLFYQIGMLLLGPLVIAIMLLIVRHIFRKLWDNLSALSAGILFSACLVPLLAPFIKRFI